MQTQLLWLSFRRSLWPALLLGGLAVCWVLWSGRIQAGSELANWSRTPGLLRYSVWMTGLLVAGPLFIGRAAAIGHRLSRTDAAWCASRPASRLSILGSSWAGASLAACAFVLLLAAAAELGTIEEEGFALQPVGPAELAPLGGSESGLVTWKLQAPANDDADVLRLPVGLIATGGPSANIRARLTRVEGGETIERDLLIATKRPIEIVLPAGEGPLLLELERVGEGALVLVPAERAEWWRVMESASSASLLLVFLGALASCSLLAWSLSLGVWMRPAAATSLVLASGVALWFSNYGVGGWGVVMEQVANGDVPGAPTLQGVGLAVTSTILGASLGLWGLRQGARS